MDPASAQILAKQFAALQDAIIQTSNDQFQAFMTQIVTKDGAPATVPTDEQKQPTTSTESKPTKSNDNHNQPKDENRNKIDKKEEGNEQAQSKNEPTKTENAKKQPASKITTGDASTTKPNPKKVLKQDQPEIKHDDGNNIQAKQKVIAIAKQNKKAATKQNNNESAKNIHETAKVNPSTKQNKNKATEQKASERSEEKSSAKQKLSVQPCIDPNGPIHLCDDDVYCQRRASRISRSVSNRSSTDSGSDSSDSDTTQTNCSTPARESSSDNGNFKRKRRAPSPSPTEQPVATRKPAAVSPLTAILGSKSRSRSPHGHTGEASKRSKSPPVTEDGPQRAKQPGKVHTMEAKIKSIQSGVRSGAYASPRPNSLMANEHRVQLRDPNEDRQFNHPSMYVEDSYFRKRADRDCFYKAKYVAKAVNKAAKIVCSADMNRAAGADVLTMLGTCNKNLEVLTHLLKSRGPMTTNAQTQTQDEPTHPIEAPRMSAKRQKKHN